MNVTNITELITAIVTLSDLLDSYYTSVNISSQYRDTGSSVLESCYCRGYVYYKWWHHLIIKHMWHRITGINKIFQNPCAQTCSVIPLVNISPHTYTVHPCHITCAIDIQSFPDPASIISWIIFLIGYLFIDSVTLSVRSGISLVTVLFAQGCTKIVCKAVCLGLPSHTIHSKIYSEKSVPDAFVTQLIH